MSEQSKAITAGSNDGGRRGIEGLFEELLGIYGKQFSDRWDGIDPATIRRVWLQGLRGFTLEEIRRGVEACYSNRFAPNLPEFRERCRPSASTVNMRALLALAVINYGRRQRGEPEQWPDTRLFWASAAIGNDLLTVPAEKLIDRFEAAYIDAADKIDDPIPPFNPANALPPPGKTTISQEEAKKRIAALVATIGKGGKG